MKKFLSTYENKNTERFNEGLINQDHDKSIEYHVMDSWKSLEVIPNIKIISAEFETDETEIDINEYIKSRSAPKKKEEKIRYQFIKDSRYGELRVKVGLTDDNGYKEIVKKMLVPVPDSKGYYTIRGTRYFLLYQLVDASTYTKGQTLITKSIIAVSVTRVITTYKDTDGIDWNMTAYSYMLFKKVVDVILFYFAKMGVSQTISYFGLNGVIKFVPEIEDTKRYVYFQINSTLFIEVDREMFEKHEYVKSVVVMIIRTTTNRLTVEELASKEYWVIKLGSARGGKQYTFLERGQNGLVNFERMLDEPTKNTLKLHRHNVKDIYALTRWMIQNYGALRNKDDVDLKNKRLRRNEYVASLLTKEFAKRANRIIALGQNVEISKLLEIFVFPGDILLTQLHRSGLLRFDDRINDMDFFSKLRYTLKGPSASGGSNPRSMPVRFRGLHPSYLGVIDINVCGSSDPGSSGVLTPFAKTDGLYFDSSYEPEDGVWEIEQEVRTRFKDENSVVNLFENVNTQEDEFLYRELFESINDKCSFKKTRLR